MVPKSPETRDAPARTRPWAEAPQPPQLRPQPRTPARRGGSQGAGPDADVGRLAGALGEAHVAALRARGVTALLPLQLRAWTELRRDESGDARPPHLLVVAPTSAGKTLIAELAIARALRRGARAFYLAPTRALAEEKFAEFSAAFAPQGRRVVCATRERPGSDPLVARGEFDLLVAVFEKMNHHLIAHPELPAGAGVVVADEIHLLGDPERGATLDLLLTKLLLSPHRPRIVGLSAVPGEAAARALGARMGAAVLLDRARPRPLHEGVLEPATGRFAYREVGAGAGRWGETTLLAPEEFEASRRAIEDAIAESEGGEDPGAVGLMAAARALAARGEQALIFAPTRSATRRWADALARSREAFASPGSPRAEATSEEAPPLDDAFRRDASRCEGRAARLLRRCMAAGVAFHNADLAEDARRDVEAAFRAGALDLVVSTSTLGMGVNLSCRNVLQYPVRLATDPVSGRPVRLPLGRARFANQGGRAGRLGRGSDAGRSIVVALSPAEAERLRATFLEAPPEPPEHPPTLRDLERAALDLLAGGFGRGPEGPVRELLRTFAAAHDEDVGAAAADSREARETRGSRDDGCGRGPEARRFEAEVAGALESLRRAGLVAREDAEDAWRPTARGERAAALGLTPAGVRGILLALGRLPPQGVGRSIDSNDAESANALVPNDARAAFELLLALARTPEGRRARGSLGLAAPRDDDYEFDSADAFLRGVPDDLEGGTRYVGDSEGARERSCASRDDRGAILAARMLLEGAMLEGAALDARTEEARRVAFEERWRVHPGAVERLAREFAWFAGAAASFAALEELPARIPAALARALERLAGIEHRAPDSAPAASTDPSAESLPGPSSSGHAPDSIASPSIQSIQSIRSIQSIQSIGRPVTPRDHDPCPDPFLLEINLESPGIVRVAGREVRLSPLGFEFLATLAERPGEVVTRAVLDYRLWPEGGSDRDRLADHRKDLVRKLRPALGDAAPEVAQTVRGIGFRLNLPRDRVLFRKSSSP